MSDVLRLIRLSLLLRVVPSLILMIAIYTGGLRVPMESVLLGLVPSMLMLGLTYVLAPQFERRIRLLLAATVLAYGIELAISASTISISSAREAPLVVPALFQIFPIMIGAWLEGRPRWNRWWFFAILTNVLVVASLALSDPGFAQFITSGGIGPLVAQIIASRVIGYFVATLADSERSKQHALEDANQKLAAQAQVAEELAVSRERVRLARDLHDTMAHSLAALVVQLQASDVLAESATPELRAQLQLARQTARDGLRETRAAIDNLRQSSAVDLGLAAALERYALAQQSPIAFEHHAEPGAAKLPPAVADAAFAVAREAIENALRHAGVTKNKIMLAEGRERVVLEISDDGAGFDPADVAEGRYGLRGMRERAEFVGAHLHIQSSPGHGTRVIFSYPAP